MDLILNSEVVPAVNQIELHPFCQQKDLREVMEQYDIKAMAWAPFAEGANGIFTNEMLAGIGGKYGKQPAQVILRWLRQMLIRGMMNNLVYLAETEECPMFRKTYRRCYRELANRLKEIKTSERKTEYNL